MSRRTRTRVEEGIYQDEYGLSAKVKLGGLPREKRFAFDTPREDIRNWRIQTRAELSTQAVNVGIAAPHDTLERDVRVYLLKREGRIGMKADRSHLRAWVALYGDRLRRGLTSADLQRAIANWTTAGVKPKTILHRRRVLRELWHALDGWDAKPPVRGLTLPRVENPAPIPVPTETIIRVATALKRSGDRQVYGRYLLLATTGARACQIMRAEPGDVQLTRTPPTWFVRPAKGGNPTALTLNESMVKAWRVFIRAKAWGSFDTTEQAKAWRAAGWPEGVRPYLLRHTLAIDLLEQGAGLDDVQAILGHTSIQTTKQFYAPYSQKRMQKVVALRTLAI